MKMELISIIVPIYNVENFVEKCIDSILNQSYTDLEILLINDGSTDGSLGKIQKYNSDSRIHIINKTNEGLSKARQYGIDLIKGKYFCTIDSDDTIDINYIEKLYFNIKKEKSDICICEYNNFDENGIRTIKLNVTSEDLSGKIISKADVVNSYSQILEKYQMSDSWNKMYRSDFVKNTNVKFTLENKYNGTDLLFNHLLLLHLPKISIVKLPLYNHRVIEGSRSQKKDKQLQKAFIVIIKELVNAVMLNGYHQKIFLQLSDRYLKMLNFAAQDIYSENIRLKEKRARITTLLNDHNEFINEDNKIDIESIKFKNLYYHLFQRSIISGKSYNVVNFFLFFEILKPIYWLGRKLKKIKINK